MVLGLLLAVALGCGGGGGGGADQGKTPTPIPMPANAPVLEYSARIVVWPHGVPLEANAPLDPDWHGAVFTVAPPLPDEMLLDPGTGTITGSPVRPVETTTFKVTATKGGQTASTTLEVTVKPPPGG
jgi:hypothetical protein